MFFSGLLLWFQYMSCLSDGAFFFPLTLAKHEKSLKKESHLLADKSKLGKKTMLPLTSQDQGNKKRKKYDRYDRK